MDRLTAQMRELLDKQAITERIYDYARSMDRLDEELGRSCFHPEAEADYGAQMYQGTGYGFVHMCMTVHPRYQSHSHAMSNIRIWMDGGTRARSETYGDVTLRRITENGQAEDSRNLGRYSDEWEKRDGEWRISRRVFVLDFDQTGPNKGMFNTTGKRDRTDPSYFGR